MSLCITKSTGASRSQGQAMVEFLVGLVCLLLAALAVLAIGLLVHNDTLAFEKAQSDAAEASMGNAFASSFTPVSEVEPGADSRYLTPDDQRKAGSLTALRSRLAGRMYQGGFYADVQRPDGTGPRAGRDLEAAASGTGTSVFGLRKGKGASTVEVPASSKSLFGIGAEMTSEHEVWLPLVGGLY